MGVDDVALGIGVAIPCGLIINELVSNSLKHAFPDKKGEINIALSSIDETIELVVGDNGIGIPENIDFRNTESLGLHLVTLLAEGQLDGEIMLDRSNGTAFHITFKKKK
jgi:two-component sensor histidine kinase